MTITTEKAERLARGCEIDHFTERAAALRSLAAERDALNVESARLRKVLKEFQTYALRAVPANSAYDPVWLNVADALGETQ